MAHSLPLARALRISTKLQVCSVSSRSAFAAFETLRTYATQTSLGTTTSPPPRPKKVTVFHDDGSRRWGDLTTGEKIARTTQQSFNFTLIAGGAVMTVVVFALMYTDVFSPQSATSHFNRAVDRIRTDQRCIELLGSGKEIRAYGEPSGSKWRRNRPLAFRTEVDKLGTERLYMHFNVSGPLKGGVVHVLMLKTQGESKFTYGYLALDVPGHSRVYIENSEANKETKKTPGKILGWRWS